MEMNQGSLRSGTESMTMLTTMIWEVQIKVKIMHALFLVEQRSTHIPEEGELDENQQKKVSILNSIRFFSFKFQLL